MEFQVLSPTTWQLIYNPGTELLGKVFRPQSYQGSLLCSWPGVGPAVPNDYPKEGGGHAAKC